MAVSKSNLQKTRTGLQVHKIQNLNANTPKPYTIAAARAAISVVVYMQWQTFMRCDLLQRHTRFSHVL